MKKVKAEIVVNNSIWNGISNARGLAETHSTEWPKRKELNMEILCDKCAGGGSECPYPQENHCEYFVEERKE